MKTTILKLDRKIARKVLNSIDGALCHDTADQSQLLATHSAEPWTCCAHDTPVWRFGPNAEKLDIVGLTSQKNDEANAKRIVACVNAMANIPSPAKAMREVREALTRFIENHGCTNGCKPDDMTCDTQFARHALKLLGGRV